MVVDVVVWEARKRLPSQNEKKWKKKKSKRKLNSKGIRTQKENNINAHYFSEQIAWSFLLEVGIGKSDLVPQFFVEASNQRDF